MAEPRKQWLQHISDQLHWPRSADAGQPNMGPSVVAQNIQPFLLLTPSAGRWASFGAFCRFPFPKCSEGVLIFMPAVVCAEHRGGSQSRPRVKGLPPL